MVGLQLAADPMPVIAAAREAGLLVVAAGGNVIRLLPPLNASADELAQSIVRLRQALVATRPAAG
jgi:acetylornithine aminotransferase/acetylornithine/N-succinyldiaminopimelate aminotransferase